MTGNKPFEVQRGFKKQPINNKISAPVYIDYVPASKTTFSNNNSQFSSLLSK